MAEHAGWLATNCQNQLNYYTAFLSNKQKPSNSNGSTSTSQQQPQQQQQQQQQQPTPPETSSSNRTLATQQLATSSALALSSSPSLQAVAEFRVDAAKALLEEEVREAFLGTAGSAAGERLTP